MRPSSSLTLKLAAFTALVSLGIFSSVRAQQPVASHDIPQSLIYEHQQTMTQLEALSHHPGAVGADATKALALFSQHTARETEYILPPLSLLPDLADGKVTPDMAWALEMTDKVAADREKIFAEHTEVTDRMNALYDAAIKAHDAEAADFAKSAAADSLNDLEILEPTVMLIGEFLRAKLPVKP